MTASKKKSKRSQYRVADEFLRFWFRYVEPNRSSIEEAPDTVYDGTIAPDLQTHVATTFEDVCQEAVWEGVRRGDFEPYSKVGRWWYREDEIDIVGLAPNDDRICLPSASGRRSQSVRRSSRIYGQKQVTLDGGRMIGRSASRCSRKAGSSTDSKTNSTITGRCVALQR